MSRQPSISEPTPYTNDTSVQRRKTALRRGEIPIAVYGLGKIGLPVAAVFAELTSAVTGVDTDPSVIESIDAGRPPFDHEPELDRLIPELTQHDRLAVTTDGEKAARQASIHIIVVPVPIDEHRSVNLEAVDAVTETIAKGLNPGDLVVIESSVPPGTCDERIRPQLVEQSGLNPDAFGVASCPERTSSGRALTDIRGAYPRVIGGVDPESTEAAFVVYDELIENRIIPVDARTAEAIKLFEGVYRDVNIALANELATAFDGTGIDVREAIDAANTQPYCDIHDPGAGVGGHCIPWYPHFLMESTDDEMPLVQTARDINDGMPSYLADRTLDALQESEIDPATADIAILGLAYRPDIPETAASPTHTLVERLESRAGSIAIVDPVIDTDDTPYDLLPLDQLSAYEPDAIILITAHRAFGEIPSSVFEDCVVIDGRDALEPDTPTTYVVGRDA